MTHAVVANFPAGRDHLEYFRFVQIILRTEPVADDVKDPGEPQTSHDGKGIRIIIFIIIIKSDHNRVRWQSCTVSDSLHQKRDGNRRITPVMQKVHFGFKLSRRNEI